MKFFKNLFKAPLTWIVCGTIIIIGLSAFFILQYNKEPEISAWFSGQGENDAYDFPIYEGTDPLEYSDIVNFLQIPEKTLNNISTEGLIETCINYPRFGDMMLYDSFQQGFDKIRDNFNGLNELYLRKDAPAKLINIFKSIDLVKLQHVQSSAILYRYICFMVAQDEILNNIDNNNIKELLIILKSHKENIEKRFSDYYSQNNPLFVEFRIYKHTLPEFNDLYELHYGLRTFVDTGIWLNLTQNEYENIIKQINEIIPK